MALFNQRVGELRSPTASLEALQEITAICNDIALSQPALEALFELPNLASQFNQTNSAPSVAMLEFVANQKYQTLGMEDFSVATEGIISDIGSGIKKAYDWIVKKALSVWDWIRDKFSTKGMASSNIASAISVLHSIKEDTNHDKSRLANLLLKCTNDLKVLVAESLSNKVIGLLASRVITIRGDRLSSKMDHDSRSFFMKTTALLMMYIRIQSECIRLVYSSCHYLNKLSIKLKATKSTAALVAFKEPLVNFGNVVDELTFTQLYDANVTKLALILANDYRVTISDATSHVLISASEALQTKLDEMPSRVEKVKSKNAAFISSMQDFKEEDFKPDEIIHQPMKDVTPQVPRLH